MANIKKIKEGTATIYPATIPQAVVDPTSGKTVRTELDEKATSAELSQLAGDIIQGTSKSINKISGGYIGSDGSVVTNAGFEYLIQKVNPGEAYSINCKTDNSQSTGVVAMYNDGTNSVLVDGDYSLSPIEFIIPANCSEIRCSSPITSPLVVSKKYLNDKFVNETISELVTEITRRLNAYEYFTIHQSVDSTTGRFTYSENWIRTPLIRVEENERFIYTGTTTFSLPITYWDSNKKLIGPDSTVAGVYINKEIIIPSGVSYVCALSKSQAGDVYSFRRKVESNEAALNLIGSTDTMSITLETIASTEDQPFIGTNGGYLINRPSSTDKAERYYMMPNGNPAGVKCKFETFATDYKNDSANYAAVNWLVYEDVFHLGVNKLGTGAVLKQIIGGKYSGSSLLLRSARTEYDSVSERLTHKFDKLTLLRINSSGSPISLQEYADNASALSGGLTLGDVYRTGDVLKIVH